MSEIMKIAQQHSQWARRILVTTMKTVYFLLIYQVSTVSFFEITFFPTRTWSHGQMCGNYHSDAQSKRFTLLLLSRPDEYLLKDLPKLKINIFIKSLSKHPIIVLCHTFDRKITFVAIGKNVISYKIFDLPGKS